MADQNFANMEKSGGDSSIGEASTSSMASGGYASGEGDASVVNADPYGTGLAYASAGAVGENAIGATGGGVTDNTDISSINISS